MIRVGLSLESKQYAMVYVAHRICFIESTNVDKVKFLEGESVTKALHQSFSNDFRKLMCSKDLSDCTVVVGDVTFYCHRLILTTRSIFFQRLFNATMNESHSQCVQFPEYDPKIFSLVLEYIYTGCINHMSSEDACLLIPIADVLLLDNLKAFCEERVMKCVDHENVSSIFLASETFNCPKLYHFCREYIAKNVKDLLDNEEFKEKVVTRPDVMIEILKLLKI